MTLTELRDQYYAGNIAKRDYIDQMYSFHAVMLEYADYIHSSDIARIEIQDEEVIVTFRSTGVKMAINRFDKRTAALEILNFGSYEPVEAALVTRLLSPGDTVFDVGANIGWYSLHLAQAAKDVRVLSFEPVIETHRKLVRNIALNPHCRVQTFNFGLSDHRGSLEFFFDPEITVRASAARLDESDKSSKIACNVRTMDDFMEEFKIKIDFIKCDVEGAEFMVFKGARVSLSRHLPIIFTEMLRKWSAKFDYHPNDVIQFLGQFGYACYLTRGQGLEPIASIDDSTEQTNFFFLHIQKHTDKIKAYSAQAS